VTPSRAKQNRLANNKTRMLGERDRREEYLTSVVAAHHASSNNTRAEKRAGKQITQRSDLLIARPAEETQPSGKQKIKRLKVKRTCRRIFDERSCLDLRIPCTTHCAAQRSALRANKFQKILFRDRPSCGGNKISGKKQDY
jgi:hypothetical protein